VAAFIKPGGDRTERHAHMRQLKELGMAVLSQRGVTGAPNKQSSGTYRRYLQSRPLPFRITFAEGAHQAMSWVGLVPGVGVMAKRHQGWVQCEDHLPYYKDSTLAACHCCCP
jgi:hypothetical protein